MTQIEDTSPVPGQRPLRLGRRVSLIIVGLLALTVVVLAGAGYAGYQAGLTQRDAQARATQDTDLARQYALGQADLVAGRYAVAQARFEYILQLDPHYQDAGQKLAQVRAAMAVTPTATPTPVTPTPSPQPSATPS